MQIPDPKANRDDHVLVENYRKKPPEWELGRVHSLKYENRFGSFDWCYEVILDRRGAKGLLRMYVGDHDLKPARGNASP